jgi:hypothetical protein
MECKVRPTVSKVKRRTGVQDSGKLLLTACEHGSCEPPWNGPCWNRLAFWHSSGGEDAG